ncbi:unnamed protein product [Psylliodes chrysocephalus]|uniref:Uncharacterized protein n=1 Tax=Psylliodes chrysocephalus TaxID=3402493 RepID=A0A9P0CVS1_9CUCU|nr:unnamed protein product [Psylliodes chrysocephala]
MRIIFLSECVLVYIVTMYYVIQFDETGDNSVAVVDENWLTPLKRQVYWPPLKDTRIFRRALAEHQEVDSEIWKVYGVKKIFFQTDDIEKAFRKEKEAQNFSDINDTDDNASNRPTKRIIRRVILTDSDDSDEESRYSRPPQIKIKKLSGAIEKRQISRTTAVTPPQNLPSTPKASRASASAQTSITDSNLGTLVNILNTIKEQNKILLEKVGNIENFVFNKGSQVFEICNPIKNPLPVDLPIGKENDLKDVEVFLKENESNFKILTTVSKNCEGKASSAEESSCSQPVSNFRNVPSENNFQSNEISDIVEPLSNFNSSIPDIDTLNGECSANVSLDNSNALMKPDLHTQLQEWALESKASHSSITSLLRILKPLHPELPLDSRSLLKTPRFGVFQNLDNGEYCHFGIQNALIHLIHSSCKDEKIKLSINIDGIPLFSSSKLQFWPILGLIRNFASSPFVIGIFYGNSKPSPLKKFLKKFIDEMIDLRISGFILHMNYSVEILNFICDAPAKAYIKGIKSHGGYSSCDKCWEFGDYSHTGGKVIFKGTSSSLRTDEQFVKEEDTEHHMEKTPLLDLKIGLVSTFTIDYMHAVCLAFLGDKTNEEVSIKSQDENAIQKDTSSNKSQDDNVMDVQEELLEDENLIKDSQDVNIKAPEEQILGDQNFNNINKEQNEGAKDINAENLLDIEPSLTKNGEVRKRKKREHAPDKLYLPSDVTVIKMFSNFKECEKCEAFLLHGNGHTKQNADQNTDCDKCLQWLEHIKKAEMSRKEYRSDKKKIDDDESLYYSTDMQKKEKSMKENPKIYDFQDFSDAVQNSTKSSYAKEMNFSDFKHWPILTTNYQLQKLNQNRPLLKDIAVLEARRGSKCLYFKTSSEDDDYQELNMLSKNNTTLKDPENHSTDREKKSNSHQLVLHNSET